MPYDRIPLTLIYLCIQPHLQHLDPPVPISTNHQHRDTPTQSKIKGAALIEHTTIKFRLTYASATEGGHELSPAEDGRAPWTIASHKDLSKSKSNQ